MQLPETPPPPKRGFFSSLRTNFLTGLAVIAPIGLTAWLIWTVVGWIDGWVLPFIPSAYNPVLLIREYTGIAVDIRGLGVATFLVFTVIVGWIAKGLIGRSMIKWADSLVLSIPGVRTIYSGLKQIVDTVVSQGERNFDKACLVQYPRKGIWAIAFISTNAKGEIQAQTEKEMVSIFMPTTPNPTSGFLLFVPKEDVTILEMTVEDAAKLVISAGLVYPNPEDPSKAPAVLPSPAQDAAE
ncbi:DUF502 domain-containing protein [Roseobacter sp. HKCCD9010]|jgi:uncharacterized membrane protein|uniref:DUF502 domain-containing protein n=1 Tax=unclassified Roseobacter TaxID=196798 RepID=UPI001199365E|nr:MULTISPECIES: DUF502 domain-containing protein [unclassified Roseobacter]MBF9050367.1 DUF502 domain-containing protein [Rhodobacterales bacterium HKCCD4356]NNV14292.1 DUF502 domain-containing protein [Roseobacter sp. HKCCD7357]NNV18485.1 DUF502 domain-containing protein [Roseobacter sp. HKCCD8768]NNV27916.1 DUF502 domain-containing protein [Roseobacter sp. HKCCD8192]NNV32217.1 DUF502 domain-containing protein [Roseobacter sp. HKCCD9061]